MQDDRRQPIRPEPWKPITVDQLPLAYAAFVMVHPTCDDAVELTQEGGSLVCWCELCQDLRTYRMVDWEGRITGLC